MNAAQTHADPHPAPAHHLGAPDALTPDARLSALVDGEADDADWAHLMAAQAHSENLAAWHRYHVIGDALRTAQPVVAQRAPQDFLAGFHARLQAEAAHAPPQRPAAPSAPATVHVRAAAANDAVFRWKLVAGLASLAAVVAVSWTVLGTAPGAGGADAGAQLALSANPTPAGVLVNTPQGPVMRDPQLEALLAEHRQYGGMSALQMPAGFLRNATYDAAGR